MYFSIFLSTLSTVLLLVYGQEFMHDEGTEPHQYVDFGSCSNARKEIMSNRKNAALLPRERHVILNAKPGYEYTPRTVLVKRCNGNCPARWSPMPVDTDEKKFIVQLQHSSGGMSKCVVVTVQEHTSCRCLCMRSKDHCNQLQQWDEQNCACNCKERDMKKRKCEAIEGMRWNDDECSCECPNEIKLCSGGWKWDSTTCQCVSS